MLTIKLKYLIYFNILNKYKYILTKDKNINIIGIYNK